MFLKIRPVEMLIGKRKAQKLGHGIHKKSPKIRIFGASILIVCD